MQGSAPRVSRLNTGMREGRAVLGSSFSGKQFAPPEIYKAISLSVFFFSPSPMTVENNFCSERFFEISFCEGLKMHAGPWFSILSVHSNHLVNSEKCCRPEPHRLNQNPGSGAGVGGKQWIIFLKSASR